MYFTDRDLAIQKTYRDEMRLQAEQWHILREDSIRTSRLQGSYVKLMLKLGIWLEKAGCSLRTRYGVTRTDLPHSSVTSSGLQSC
jgi:hypothetical protein